MRAKIVTLTSDFGLKDPYIAEMKAVILSICPNAVIIDITHEVAKFNIRMGAFVLSSAMPYFPDGTVHVVVVDPGVGTLRRSIVIKTKRSFLIGPDNGLLILAAQKQSIESIHELTNPRLMMPEISNTFHGRDVFAPAAAHLLKGTKPAEFGPEISEAAEAEFAKVTHRNDTLIGEVLHVDGFGNIITNISRYEVKQMRFKSVINVELASSKLKLEFCKTYGETKPREPTALIGSHGFLEISISQGNAAEKFKIKAGDSIRVSPA